MLYVPLLAKPLCLLFVEAVVAVSDFLGIRDLDEATMLCFWNVEVRDVNGVIDAPICDDGMDCFAGVVGVIDELVLDVIDELVLDVIDELVLDVIDEVVVLLCVCLGFFEVGPTVARWDNLRFVPLVGGPHVVGCLFSSMGFNQLCSDIM